MCIRDRFVIDLKREHNAVAEARRLRIPLVAIVDTNADPDLVDYPIAGNDDAIRSIKILLQAVTEAIAQGKAEADAKKSRRINRDEPAAPAPAAAPAAAPAPTEAAPVAPTAA
jgi:small subunit ribosomal protein S2